MLSALLLAAFAVLSWLDRRSRMLALAPLLLVACGVPEFFEDGVGTVYTCTDGTRTEEWCSRLSADEVSAIRDLDCHETSVGDRWWPGVTNALGHGCDYSCEPHVGCNAHVYPGGQGGCLCPGNGLP